jgi:hypothetical protein
MMSNQLGGNRSVTTGRRVLAAAAGASLVAGALFTAYQTARRMYYDYYFYARVKEEYIAPDRRVRLMDGLFVIGLIVVSYIAYRLLRYAIRPYPRANQ